MTIGRPNGEFDMKKQNKQAELDMFNAERHDDFDLGSEESCSILKNAIRKFLPKVMDERCEILEVGCGTGYFGMEVVKEFKNVSITGVDIAPAMIKWINSKKIERYNGVVGDVEDPSLFGEKAFDLIICPFVLHHFPDPSIVIENASRWLKDGGVLLMLEPNGSSFGVSLFNFGRRVMELLCGKKYTARFATCNETTHSFGRYKRLLVKNGFCINERRCFGKFPRNKSSLLGVMRMVVHSMLDFLPEPFCGEGLCVVACK